MYYVYTLAKPNGEVFYVGKGKNYRIDDHEREARNNKSSNDHKIRTIRKIWASGGQVVKKKIFETAVEEEAYNKEKEVIKKIGLQNLTNILPGGEGKVAGTKTPEHSVAMRERNLNAKTWKGLIDPFGVEYPNIVNLYRFCEEHDLTYTMVVEVIKGNRDHYKGWRVFGSRCWTETEEPQQDKIEEWEINQQLAVVAAVATKYPVREITVLDKLELLVKVVELECRLKPIPKYYLEYLRRGFYML
jgi:hypothetical protein